MAYLEIEVKAKTVELAVEAAMKELGVEDRDQLAVEVVREAERGFLGLGGQDAVIRARRKRGKRRRQERRKRGRAGEGTPSRERAALRSGNNRDTSAGGGRKRRSEKEGTMGRHESRPEQREDDRNQLALADQARIAKEFLEGLIEAFGLEGTVSANVVEETIVVDISGEQTEALVGVRGTVRAAVHELTRTVLQRYTRDAARIRLDIAGYAERRRQALTIYADRLIDQILEEGGEIMLEPMSPADRKVIHDAAAARVGVISYSEGESPRRYVVLSLTGSDDRGEEE